MTRARFPLIQLGPFVQASNINNNPEDPVEDVAINITRNDSYDAVANDKLAFTVSKDYTGWSGSFTIRHRLSNAQLCQASVTVASSSLLQVTLAVADTAFTALTELEDFGPHPFDIEMTSGSSKQTAVTGIANIYRDETT